MTSFFISYTRADRDWAEWIAQTLEDNGHQAVFDVWDFRPGANFVLEMHRAAAETDKTILVLSENYLSALYTQPEWASAFVDDPRGHAHKIFPIRVRECQPTGLLKSVVYVDLIGLDESDAQEAIVRGIKERGKPSNKTIFPISTKCKSKFPAIEPSKPWNVPYERNTFFTGREDILQALHQQLGQGKAATLFQTQAISGLGGIGKTQTAVEYAYRHRHEYEAVFWIRAETETETRTGFVEIARLLNLPMQDEQDIDEIISSVKQQLEKISGWLLIFDNADYLEQLKPFLPSSSYGHILLTSRAQLFDSLGIAQPVALDKMLPEEASDFLIKRTAQHIDEEAEAIAIEELATELGYLPLALEQAGAYILAQKMTFTNYLKSYRIHHLELLQKKMPVTGSYPESVATTWVLNFTEVERISHVSAALLKVSAFLSPDAIPYELFERGGKSLGDELAPKLAAMADDPASFSEILAPLIRYSLILVEPSIQVYSIARLVQEVIVSSLDKEECHLWRERTIEAVIQAFPNAEYRNWIMCERLLPHARGVIDFGLQHQIESETLAVFLGLVGQYLNERAQFNEAKSLLTKALQMRKKLLGDSHPDVAISLNNLAFLYDVRGHYEEAEPLYFEALQMNKHLFGDNHLEIARNLNNLAGLYNEQGRYGEAEPLLLEALQIHKQLLGNSHADVATGINNLAYLYNDQGRYKEAERMYFEALQMRKQLFDKSHPDIALSLSNLASLYHAQGRYEEAESLLVEALQMRKHLFGDNHHSIAQSLNNLAALYNDQARYEEAEPLLIQALQMYKQLFGDSHPDIALGLNNLAFLYGKQGNYEEAEPLLIKALKIRRQLLGDSHPDVAGSLNNLASIYKEQARYEEAEPLLIQALQVNKQLFSNGHPDVARSLNNLAGLYYRQSRHEEAEPLLLEALQINKQLLGNSHPSTLMVHENLRKLQKDMARHPWWKFW